MVAPLPSPMSPAGWVAPSGDLGHDGRALPFRSLVVAFERSGLRKHPDVGPLACR